MGIESSNVYDRSSSIFLGRLVSKVRGDLAELFQGGFEIVDNFLGENVGIGEVGGFFAAFFYETKDGEPRLVTVDVSPYFSDASKAMRNRQEGEKKRIVNEDN